MIAGTMIVGVLPAQQDLSLHALTVKGLALVPEMLNVTLFVRVYEKRCVLPVALHENKIPSTNTTNTIIVYYKLFGRMYKGCNIQRAFVYSGTGVCFMD